MSCRARSGLSSSTSTTTHRTLLINRVCKYRDLQHRSLWWWGRHGTWSSANEYDALEERVRRAQKIMMKRYSRALERRSTWERADSPQHWRWSRSNKLLARVWTCKPFSTSDSLNVKIQEKESGIPRQDKPWDQIQKDFEAYKAKVDEAIARDPYGFLFGRLPRSSGSANSSWASFSNIFESEDPQLESKVTSKTVKAPVKIKIETRESTSSKSKPKFTPAQPPTSNIQTSISQADIKGEYVYDPVSGRKVLASSQQRNEPEIPQKSFLETLFSEHPENPDAITQSSKQSEAVIVEKPKDLIFENSRLREYSQLRVATIGTNLDTTATFGGKYEPSNKSEHESTATFGDRYEPSNKSEYDSTPRWKRDVLHDEDALPLFAGTTYQNKDLSHRTPASASSTTSSWLRREGFDSSQALNRDIEYTSAVRTEDRLEPAFDRMSSSEDKAAEKKHVNKLQPAIDRIEILKGTEPRKSPLSPLGSIVDQSTIMPNPASISQSARKHLDVDTREDLDLLRPSDVRAATKTARITRQETDQANAEARAKLEQDFLRRQKHADMTSDVESARSNVRNRKNAAGIQGVVKHVQRYPEGIVAKTMQSMSLLNEHAKKHLSFEESRTDLTEKLELTPEALNKLPSIYKDVKDKLSSKKADSIAEALEVEKARAASSDLRDEIRMQDIQKAEQTDREISHLGAALHSIYQTYNDSSQPKLPLEPATSRSEGAAHEHREKETSAHPLRTATVKAGVPRHPVIEHHTHEFEPKLIELRQKLKDVAKAVPEIKQEVASIAQNRSVQDVVAAEQQSRYAATKSSKEPIISAKEIEGVNSKTQMDLISEQNRGRLPSRTPPPAITSAYVILTYNKHTREVDITQLNRLIGFNTAGIKPNPISVMSELGNAAAFVMRFSELERAGYTLMGGGGDVLVFQKQSTETRTSSANAEALESVRSIKFIVSEIRNKIALEESRSQPAASSSALPPGWSTAVADEAMIRKVESTSPRSSAPLNEGPHPKKRNKDGLKVRRQEQVFSGTLRSNSGDKHQRRIPPSPPPPPENKSSGPGPIVRSVRVLERAVLIIVAMGGVAYLIGVVSEGSEAHKQYQQAISEGADEGAVGPRRKIVMPNSRPGFYSTEGTRD